MHDTLTVAILRSIPLMLMILVSGRTDTWSDLLDSVSRPIIHMAQDNGHFLNMTPDYFTLLGNNLTGQYLLLVA
ncbi:hypothetical protein BDZ89DRAFT_785160 [Hymenopellis radicata]|nr:hypothetical protein BDZ89DRAFT_785160 [Hymenopellis radicata]